MNLKLFGNTASIGIPFRSLRQVRQTSNWFFKANKVELLLDGIQIKHLFIIEMHFRMCQDDPGCHFFKFYKAQDGKPPQCFFYDTCGRSVS